MVKHFIISSLAVVSLSNCQDVDIIEPSIVAPLSPSPTLNFMEERYNNKNTYGGEELLIFSLHSEYSDDYPPLHIINAQISEEHQFIPENYDEARIDERTRVLNRENDRSVERIPDPTRRTKLHRYQDRSLVRQREHKEFNNGSVVTKHFMEAWIGSPPQRMSLIVSTTSQYTVIGCGMLGTIDNPVFRNHESLSFEKLICEECSDRTTSSISKCQELEECAISGTYIQTTYRAFEARDLIRVGGPTSNVAFMHSFACQETNRNLNSLGIVSMSSQPTSFPNQMYQAKKIMSADFSLCFNPPGESVESGVITLGGYNSEIITTPMVYAKNTKVGNAPYTFYIKKVFLRQGGGSSVVPIIPNQPIKAVQFDRDEFNSGQGAVLNVETPYTLFHNSIEESFRETWKEVTGMEYVYSTLYIKDEDALRMPTILVQLQAHEPDFEESNEISVGMVGVGLDSDSPYDVLLAIPPTQYLEKLSTGLYRTRISLKNKNGSVLGANLINGRLLHFSTSRVGFAEIQSCRPQTNLPTQSPRTPMPTRETAPPTKSRIEGGTLGTDSPTSRSVESIDGRIDEPSDINDNFVGYESVKFLQFYFYAIALVAMLGLGLIILSVFEKGNKTYRVSTLSL